ncbi:DNA helicase UvrD [Prevotella sp. P4-67]|uniref:ATP-dependent helicase n=1 Tax=Prevotella sp. P4-67 TaxID=2024227 RepID=UPI000B95EBA9|nr:ATP-dependent DNA helicase [Prevotella sp. P4-67]OYP70636.1 DNA helicase UvrD [Prevotella sp. P4-67]
MELNKDQLQIVNQTEGPVLVIAGPGSGKTKTLVDRIVNLVQKGVQPEEIMVGTFTEKAAKELITRISNLLLQNGIQANLNEMYIGTLHSIFLRFLEENREFTRLKRSYRLFDQFEQVFTIFRHINEFMAVEDITELIGDHRVSYWRKAASIAEKLNTVSEEILDVEQLKQSDFPSVKALAACYSIYEQILEEENALDFSSIQFATYQLFTEHPDVLSKIQDKVRYFMVDEYQDTNTIQERILLMLASKNNNICVVGDDDQGLYRFRGATIRNILEFDKNFPEGECKVFFLQTNYRSDPQIIEFYNRWMQNQTWTFNGQTFRFDKTIVPREDIFPDTPTVLRLSAENDTEEYHAEVLRFIRYLENEHIITDYNQIAFLFRSVKSDKAKALADYLEENGIKVFSPRSDMFFEREEIRLMLGCLVSLFPQVEALFEQGTTTSGLCLQWSDFFIQTLQEDPEGNKDLIRWVMATQQKHAFLDKGTDYGMTSLVYRMFQYPLFAKYLKVDLDANKTDLRAAYNIGMFTSLVSKFEYLYGITIFTPKNIEQVLKNFFNYYLRFLVQGGMSEFEDFDETLPSGCVSFMTIHQSKGLEFPITIVGSMNAVPTKGYTDLDEILQTHYFHKPIYEPLDEIKYFDFARLYYTAFSRAQNLLLLTGCEQSTGRKTPSAYFAHYWNNLPKWNAPQVDLHKVDLAKVKPTNVKHEYSFTSHILLYENCPRQYEFYKELQFVEERKGSTMGGSLLHQTIEDIHKAVLRGESNLLTNENIESWFNTNYQLLIKQLHSYLNEPQREAILRQVLNYRDVNAEFWHRIKEAEVDVSLVKEDYILKGKIDLVEGEDGTVELVDFKSGDKPDVNTRDEYKRQILNQYRRQLEIYAYLIEQRYGHKVSAMHLYYPKVEDGNPRITFRYQQQNVDSTIQSFEEVVSKIEKKDFSMENVRRNERHCSDCDLRFFCNFNC